jgi:putative inorganic carbon (HCO3(-)) transporter
VNGEVAVGPESTGAASPGMRFAVVAAATALAISVAIVAILRPEAVPIAFTPLHIAALAAGVAFLFLVTRHSSIALPFLVAIVYLNLSEVLVRFHGFPSVLQLVALPLFVAAWLGGGSVSVADVLRQGLTRWLMLLVAFVATASTWAKDVDLADERVGETIKSLAIFVLVVLLATSLRRLELAIVAIVASASFLSVLPIAQALFAGFENDFGGLARIKRAQIYGDVFQARIAGPLGDPNFFAQILLIALPLAVFLARSTSSVRLKLLGSAAIALVFVAILLSYSRGAMLSAIVMGAAVLPVLRVDWRKLATLAAIGLTVFVLLPRSVTERFVTIEQVIPGFEESIEPDTSFEERRLLVGTAWVMFGDRPLTGVGPGNYTVHFDDYAARVGAVFRVYGDPNATQYPHNLYLEYGAETGAIGLALFLAAVVTFFRYTRRSRSLLAGAAMPHQAGLAFAIEVAMLGYLVSSLFLHGHFQRYLWLLFALGAAVDLLARRVAKGEAV